METIMSKPEKLILRGEVSEGLANAIRRSIEEIYTLAIEEVEFFKNDSALYDEILAHRLGLVPLKTDGKMGQSTVVELKIKKSGPCVVYSGDLQGNAKIIYDKIPLTTLEKDQSLELVATAKLGKGIEHAKYVPGLGYYRHLFEVKSTGEIDEIIENSTGEIKPEKKGNRWVCDLKEAEIDEIMKLDGDAVKETGELLFMIESWGHLDADNILKKSIESLESNLDEFEKFIKQ